MEYKDYKEQIIDKTPNSEGMLYSVAAMWLHPRILPLAVVQMGNCTDRIVKIPNWSGEKRVVQWMSGPELLEGPPVPITTFNKKVFSGNSRITDIILQSNIEKIPQGAFENCKNLTRICIPKKIKIIGLDTFKNCDNLKDVYYEGTQEEWNQIRIINCVEQKPEDAKSQNESETQDDQPLLYKDEGYDIPGNYPLTRATIHYNCEPAASAELEKPHPKGISALVDYIEKHKSK